jgi:pyridoxine 5'-phosphate synthase PdxJ
MKVHKDLNEKFMQQFKDLNTAFDLQNAQFNLEFKKLDELKTEFKEKKLSPEAVTFQLAQIRSPFTTIHQKDIDNLQNELDQTMTLLKENHVVLEKLKTKVC